MACALVFCASALPFAAAQSDDDRPKDNSYYDEDGWLSLTQWIDTSDFDVTAERTERREEGAYERSIAKESDRSSRWIFDSELNSQVEQSSKEDSRRVGPDAGKKRKARGDSTPQYGYDTRYDADNWFYDFWDDGYRVARDADRDGHYEYTYTYFDYDGDGNYDGVYSYYDYNGDGYYDDTDHIIFSGSARPIMKQREQDPGSSKRQAVSGSIAKLKKATVRDTRHWIAALENEQEKLILVDLGPVTNSSLADLRMGEQLTVAGPRVPVGQKQVIMAHDVTRDGKIQTIYRDSQYLSGQVAGTRTAQVHGADHVMAILATGNDRKTLVDLGHVRRLDMALNRGDRIRIKGVPAKVNDRRVIMAHQVERDGEAILIDRSRKPREAAKETRKRRSGEEDSRLAVNRGSFERTGRRDELPEQGQVAGDVLWKKKLSVRGQERSAITVESRTGKRWLVDLGPAENMNLTIRQGDRVEARGRSVKNAKGERVLIAKRIEINGRRAELRPDESRRGDRSRRSIRGKIVKMYKATVRNQPRQVVEIEKPNGELLTVDLGSPRYLDVPLDEGAQIEVRGVSAKVGKQIMFIAETLARKGEKPVLIERRPSADVSSKRTSRSAEAPQD